MSASSVPPKDAGILDYSGIFLNAPSPFAVNHLFYPLWSGEYLCQRPYCVDRDWLDAFLFFYIEEGTLYFRYRSREFTAGPGDLVLLDCKYHNLYWAEEPVRFGWFHFGGGPSQAYTDMLWERHGPLFSDCPSGISLFKAILRMMRLGTDSDDMYSVNLYRLFAALSIRYAPVPTLSEAVASAKDYIEAHFAEPIQLEDIAAAASMSRYHLSRLFQREMGFSPHEYLIETRLRAAKNQLSDSDASVEQIAINCGFSCSSNFIRAFRQNMGMTPLQFRKWF